MPGVSLVDQLRTGSRHLVSRWLRWRSSRLRIRRNGPGRPAGLARLLQADGRVLDRAVSSYGSVPSMARISIVTGLLLILLGVGVTIAADSQSVTSLIPAFIGAVFLLLGLGGVATPGINDHLMHAAAVLSLLAILGSAGSLIGRGATGWALFAQVTTIVIAGTFLALAIRSFKAARAARQTSPPAS